MPHATKLFVNASPATLEIQTYFAVSFAHDYFELEGAFARVNVY